MTCFHRPYGALAAVTALLTLAPHVDAAQPGAQVQWDYSFGTGARVRGCEALPGGGAIFVSEDTDSGMGSVHAVEVTRLDDAGTVQWRTSLPANFFDGVTYTFAVSPDGHALLGLCTAHDLTLRRLDPAGQVDWTRTVLPPSGRTFHSATAAFTPSGDALLGVPVLDGGFSPVFDDFLVTRLGGASGATVWSRVLENRGSCRMEVDGAGGIHLLSIDGNPWSGPTVDARYRRLNAQGTTVADGSFQVQAEGSQAVEAWHVASDGSFTVLSTFTDYAKPIFRFTSVDPGGAVEWTRLLSGSGSAHTALLEGGDVLLVRGGGVRLRVDRQSTERSIPQDPQLTFRGVDLLALTDGGYAVREADSLGTVVRCTADDAVAWAEDAQLFRTDWQPMREGMSGRIVLAGHLVDLFFAGDGHAVQFGETWNEPSVVSCAASVPNSTGGTGRLRAVGSDDAADNDLTLRFFQLPPGQFLLPLASMESGSTVGAGGNLGELCLGGAIGRFPTVLQVSSIGTSRLRLDLTRIPGPSAYRAVMAGETWYFQGWHRDVDGGPVSNMTDAVRVKF